MPSVPGLDQLDILGESTDENKAEDVMDGDAQTDKAHIIVKESCTVNCGIYEDPVIYEEDQIIPVQFNPTSYTIQVSSNFKDDHAGITQDSLTFGQYSSPVTKRLSVKLLYDSIIQIDYLDKVKDITNTAKNAVKSMSFDVMGVMDAGQKVVEAYLKYNDEKDLNESYIKLITNLARASDLARPPLISFVYGNMEFVGHVSSVDVNFMRFNKDGDVIRAEISISIDEAMSDDDSEGLSGMFGGGSSGGSVIEDNVLNLKDMLK